MIGQHTAECLRKAAEVDQQIRDWETKWPNHCQKCHGRGGFFYPATREEPESTDPCDCTLQGLCPRCGITGLNEDGEGPCDNCSWDYDDARTEPWNCWSCQDDDP